MRFLVGTFVGGILCLLGGVAAIFYGATRRPW